MSEKDLDKLREELEEKTVLYLVTFSGVNLIQEERNRQITEEGYDWKRDTNYHGEELALAAAVYAIPLNWRGVKAGNQGHTNLQRILWPWEWKSFKPVYTIGRNSTVEPIGQSIEDRIKELSKAGALIAAEIDRLQRLKIKNLNNEN